MGVSLKEQLSNRPDAREREVKLTSVGGEPLTVTVRRLSVFERDQLIKEFKIGSEEGKDKGVEASVAIVAMALVQTPSITVEEVRAMPAAIVDEVASHIMDFNGWTKAGKAALDDQFRAPAGTPV